MTEVTAREMALVRGLKHAIVTGSAPGLSVNAHPNAFFLNVIGEVDLLRAAKAGLVELDQFDKEAAARAAKKEAETAAKVVSDPDGHG